MKWEPRERTIFDVFVTEEEVNRIIGGNIQLFADFVLLLLRNNDSVEFIVYIFKIEMFSFRSLQRIRCTFYE